MNFKNPVLLSALALNAVLGMAAVARGQYLAHVVVGGSHADVEVTSIPTSGAWISAGQNNLVCVWTPEPPPPQGSAYHQVVDVYFDSNGNKLDTKSETHLVTYDCHRGKRVDDLVAQDDGKGNVRFPQLFLPSEPATGQQAVTKDMIVKIIASARATPVKPTELALSR